VENIDKSQLKQIAAFRAGPQTDTVAFSEMENNLKKLNLDFLKKHYRMEEIRMGFCRSSRPKFMRVLLLN
jgi:hypothetical protein